MRCPRPRSRAHRIARGTGRAVAIVAGALIALLATVLLLGGGVGLWADSTQRDADGWLTSPWHRFDTPTRALTAEGLQLGDLRGGPDAWVDDLGSIRVRARRADGGPVFVGLAPEARVDAYLRGVSHSEVNELRSSGYRGTVREGARVPAAPTAAGWAASASGRGTQTARWDPESGKWAIVVMNADAVAGHHRRRADRRPRRLAAPAVDRPADRGRPARRRRGRADRLRSGKHPRPPRHR